MVEIDLSNFEKININNSCLVEPNPTVLEIYKNDRKKYGLDRSFNYTSESEGLSFQIWDLLHIYSPFFDPEIGKPPFEKIGLSVTSSFYNEPEDYRHIKVTDFVYFQATREGAELVRKAFPKRIASREPETLTNMQFFHIAYIFGPKFYMGNNVQYLVRNSLYLPK